MHRTEGDNFDISTGVNLFTNGPPGTTVNAEWLNAVQEELASVIEGAGYTLKNKDTDTWDQLRTAILQTAPLPRGFIDGLTMANNVADAAKDIDISIGKCRNTGDTVSMFLNAAITKKIDAAWAQGTNQGGFPTGLGAVAADTWYHVFVISNADGSVTDGGFDTSLIATNLLADAAGDGFTVYRRIGSVLTDATPDIIAFFQYPGGHFRWKDPILDVNGVASGTSVNLITISTPLNIVTKAKLSYVTSGDNDVYFKNPSVDDEAPNLTGAPGVTLTWFSGKGGFTTEVLTNESSQVNYRTNISRATYITCYGWQDERGKDL